VTVAYREVVGKKIHVEGSLHDATDPYDDLRIVVLVEVAVHPVEKVKEAVHPEECNVVGRNVLACALLLQQEELGNDCHRLEVEGERPQPLRGGEDRYKE
jgi:hypothetical protein